MCLNGNFDTFCFDFTNVTEVTVRKYFAPPMRSQILVCMDELPRQALWKGLQLWGEEVLVPNLFTLSRVQLIVYGSIREAGTLQLPQCAVAPVGQAEPVTDRSSSFLSIQTKNGEIIHAGGPVTARMWVWHSFSGH